MTCANCLALREELAIMRRTVGAEVRQGEPLKLVHGLGITYSQAQIVVRMYHAKRPLTPQDFLNTDTVISTSNLRVQISKMRRKLGRDVVPTAKDRNSGGYALNADFRRQVAACLEPQSNP